MFWLFNIIKEARNFIMISDRKKDNSKAVIPLEHIEKHIYFMRGKKVMLSTNLAELYEVEVRVLVQAVKRNIDRFPEDFMFQLTEKEHEILNSSDLQAIDKLRKIRNKVAHKETEIGASEAKALLRDGEKIIISLSSLSKPTVPQTGLPAFDWLMENYNNSIEILRGEKAGNPSDILDKAIDAWNNRDGAIAT